VSAVFETLEVRFADGVIDVELQRPASLNAISQQLADELVEATAGLAHRPDAKVLVLRGAGRAFCAGADVGVADAVTPSAYDQVIGHQRMQSAFTAFERLPVAKIAQVHGHCVGAGFVLAAMCELRIASPDAQFSIPELDFGIPFSMGGLPRVARYIGLTRTADLVLTGRRMPAEEAYAAGFLTRVVHAAELDDVVRRTAAAVARHPGYLVSETVTRLREAGEELLAGSRSDLSSLTLATLDPECRDVMAAYAERVLGRSKA
jgi:enoyl-CoA hydratase/carnithine racemase